ncbi:MAG: FAD-binding oxidoreductase [Alphaproteobacteria bacterium]
MAAKLPDLGDTCGWFNVLEPPSPSRRIEGRQKADWVVVGAGVTGLAAARRLAEHKPGARILLLDATRIGNGNSGRNSGFALHCWFMGATGYSNDLTVLHREARLNGAGAETLRRQVRENQIECHWHDFGMLWAAAGPAGEGGVADRQKGFGLLEQDCEMLDGKAMQRLTGSSFYTMGVRAKGTALVNPAAMCRGLARTLPANVTVYDQTPVTGLRRGRPHVLSVAGGEIETENLILCTNTFSPGLGFARFRMAPVSNYASLTRVLSDDELKEVGGEGPWGLLPGVTGGSTVRRTSDNRIMIRHGARFVPQWRFTQEHFDWARTKHYQSIAKRWPALKDVAIEHTWGGVLGTTRNRGHIFGRLDDNIWGSIACNGANVAKGTAAGGLLADHIVGATSPLLNDMHSQPKPAWLPPDFILGYFVNKRRHIMAQNGADEA